jgi:hypothetical protein
MKFQTPQNISSSNTNNFISPKIKFISTNTNNHTVISTARIKTNEIILIETPCTTLYGELDIDRGLQTIQKYMLLADHPGIQSLYPRENNSNTFPRTPMIKQIHKIITTLPNKYNKLHTFFSKYNKTEIEFYYAKYLFNAFEGYSYGPLTLPLLAKFNHSCDSNVTFQFDVSRGVMIVRATQEILPNQELFNSYLYNKTIPNHWDYLLEHYGFSCNCKIPTPTPAKHLKKCIKLK